MGSKKLYINQINFPAVSDLINDFNKNFASIIGVKDSYLLCKSEIAFNRDLEFLCLDIHIIISKDE